MKSTVSTTPMMAASTGLSFIPSARRADEPATTRTRSWKPAPTVSPATTYPPGPVLPPRGEARGGAGDDEDALVEARADRVHGDNVARGVRAVEVQRAHDEQLVALQALVLLRRDDGAEDARDNHRQVQSAE